MMTITIHYYGENDLDYKQMWLCYDNDNAPEHRYYTCDDDFKFIDITSPLLVDTMNTLWRL